MNSSEQKEYEYITPTSQEVEETITLINKKLESLKTNLSENKNVNEGYTEALRLLTENNNSYDDITSSLTTDVSRAIAVLAVDYINGECSREVFLDFGNK
jgi:ribosome maturation factor RimP